MCISLVCSSFHLNIILPSSPGSAKPPLSFRFPHQDPVHAYPLPHTCYMPTHLIHSHNIAIAILLQSKHNNINHQITNTLKSRQHVSATVGRHHERYRPLSSSLCNFFPHPVTSSFLASNTALSTLLSNTPIHITGPYKDGGLHLQADDTLNVPTEHRLSLESSDVISLTAM